VGRGAAQPATLRFPTTDEFVALPANRRVLDAQRRAKYVLMLLSGDQLLATHMMLWGTLRLLPSEQPRAKEVLVIWHLDRDEDLRLTDQLRYARAALGPPDIATQRLDLDLDSLDLDALDPSFTTDVLAKWRSVLCTVLINQRVLVGLGIRDADESLWLAQIDPRRSPASLTADEIACLHAAIVQTLTESA